MSTRFPNTQSLPFRVAFQLIPVMICLYCQPDETWDYLDHRPLSILSRATLIGVSEVERPAHCGGSIPYAEIGRWAEHQHSSLSPSFFLPPPPPPSLLPGICNVANCPKVLLPQLPCNTGF